MSNLRTLDCSGTQLHSLPHSPRSKPQTGADTPLHHLWNVRFPHHRLFCCLSTGMGLMRSVSSSSASGIRVPLVYVRQLRSMLQSDCVLIFLVFKPLRAQMHPEDGPPLPVVQRVCGPLQPSLLLSVHVVHLVGVCLCLCRRLHAVHPTQGTAECESPFPPLCSDQLAQEPAFLFGTLLSLEQGGCSLGRSRVDL